MTDFEIILLFLAIGAIAIAVWPLGDGRRDQ